MQRRTGKFFAVKIVSNRIDCNREVQLLRLCQGHENIVQLQDVFQDEVIALRECSINIVLFSKLF